MNAAMFFQSCARFRVAATRVLLALAFLALALPAKAQVLPFRPYRVKDGLVANNVTCITQDKDGYIWIGTSDGVSVFDGVEMRSYTTKDGLAYPYVNTIAQGRGASAGMWIATNGGGVNHVRQHRFTTIRIGNTLHSNRVNALLFDAAGAVWCGTDSGLYRIVNETPELVPLPEECAVITGLAPLSDSLFALQTLDGLYVFSSATRKVQRLDLGPLSLQNAHGLRAEANGDLRLVTTANAILTIRKGRIEERCEIPHSVQFVERDVHGFAWIGTQEGLYYCPQATIDPSRLVRYGIENGLPGTTFNVCFSDREGNMWFGTGGRGIAMLETRHQIAFPSLNLTGRGLMDRYGRIWLSCEAGIWEFHRSQAGSGWERYLHRSTAAWPTGYAFDMQLDPRGNLWVAFSNGGVAMFPIGRSARFATPIRPERAVRPGPAFPAISSYKFAVDSSMRMWCITNDGSVRVYDLRGEPKLLRALTSKDGIPEIPRVAYVDRKNAVWISGFEHGVCVVETESDGSMHVTQKGRSGPLAQAAVRTIYHDSRGTVWFGTRRHGLISLVGDVQRAYTGQQGLLNDQVWSIGEGANGVLWLGTEVGLGRMLTFTTEFRSDQSSIDSPVYSCGEGEDGTVWAVTRDGLTILGEDAGIVKPVPLPISITRFQVNERERTLGVVHDLASDENNCRIDFTCVSFRNTLEMRYQFRLDGIDTAWRAPTRDRSVTLAALGPGAYTFRVRALTGEGRLSANEALLRFTIARPVWQRWWFSLGILLVLAAVIAVVVRFRVLRLVEIERIRSRIAADLHDDIGSGLTRIALLSEVMTRQLHLSAAPSAKEATSASEGPALRTSITRIGEISRELVDAMSDVVWSIDPKNDSLTKLSNRIKVFAVEMCEARDITLSFSGPDAHGALRPGSDACRCMLLVAKEAVKNAVIHSGCSRATVSLALQNGTLCLHVIDDGRGFDRALLSRINGLENMRLRVAKAGGTFSITSAPGQGTDVCATLTFPR